MLLDNKGNRVNPPRGTKPEQLVPFREVLEPTKDRDPKGMFSLGERATLKEK